MTDPSRGGYRNADLVYMTGNPRKAERLSLHLKRPVRHIKMDLPEIQSLDVEEVVRHKADAAYSIVGEPVLVEDYSLRFFALGHLPGPLIKWFTKSLTMQQICDLIKPGQSRLAVTHVAMGYCNADGAHVFTGERQGHISLAPRGPQVWGPDAIFIPDGWERTWAEMSEDERQQTSVRRLAVQKLEAFLRSSEG